MGPDEYLGSPTHTKFMSTVKFIGDTFRDKNADTYSGFASTAIFVESSAEMQAKQDQVRAAAIAAPDRWWTNNERGIKSFATSTTEYLQKCQPLELNPVLILVGSYAPITTNQEPGRRLRRALLPNGEVRYIPHCKQWWAAEYPE